MRLNVLMFPQNNRKVSGIVGHAFKEPQFFNLYSMNVFCVCMHSCIVFCKNV